MTLAERAQRRRWTRWILPGALVTVFHVMVILIAVLCGRDDRPEPAPAERKAPPPPPEPVRTLPSRFPANTHMPKSREGRTSGSIDLKTFSAGSDLIRLDDKRAWWESDDDRHDSEDDHVLHRSMERPLRKLINLVSERGAVLKIHDAYRADGIHNPRSLHKEGRAVDVTCKEMSMEELSKLCWLAGFDWVYYEAKGRGGAHVHCSVRRSRGL